MSISTTTATTAVPNWHQHLHRRATNILYYFNHNLNPSLTFIFINLKPLSIHWPTTQVQSSNTTSSLPPKNDLVENNSASAGSIYWKNFHICSIFIRTSTSLLQCNTSSHLYLVYCNVIFLWTLIPASIATLNLRMEPQMENMLHRIRMMMVMIKMSLKKIMSPLAMTYQKRCLEMSKEAK